MTETLTATYRVVTPLFMSGADQSRAELRLPSIKGALRFWWRALAWERLGGDLEQIRRQEAELFGSTDTGQAGVLMRLRAPEVTQLSKGVVLKDGGRVVGEGARYLGYGVMEAFASRNKGTQEGQLTRACLAAPFDFTLQVCFKPNLTPKQRDGIVDALKLLGTVGALGSKARKGYGSLVLKEYQDGEKVWQAPQDIIAIKEELEKLKSEFKLRTDKPPYTAFSRESKILLVEGEVSQSPLELLNRIGREMVFYRSWGNNGKVFDQNAEQNFPDDHDLMKAIASGGTSSVSIEHPERVAFGLPHNYFFSSTKDKAEVKAVDATNPRNPTAIERRASPLQIHIHQIGDTPIAVLTFLPSQFLPANAKIRLIGKQQKVVSVDTSNNLWQPIHEFFERMKNVRGQPHLQRKEDFGRVVEVRYA
ncbi:type III-B CRISPR module RAMP protein Cmr1 [Truepera radiovictrix]|uniref:CRISPR-associated RAMP protein, Cmr1 family n=1 Tax=Truepera radiovictrix (strain DSM 17093 / CIP 108686 / LMG 22925 / RQ-24) TaxID=649638 RepID=D7CXG7_TRURR|nr:type III-B CRISPR module RAMP protein Cmr1 [Truepera radiovictrix]ADI14569.1 CRISPR-associated RAMP protein, Cmr1 family [Truepera radiovictrix DSM 17093]WMT56881.1 type III-B CRISPR module RAMP protein Cmr1 [Truepera radiovictrix]